MTDNPIPNVSEAEGQSADIVAGNIDKLKEIFPDAFTEGGVDFDTLRQLLGDASVLDEGDEKYGLNWHGKKKARQIALTPSTGTLLPCPEESVDWDTTQNLFIEGDNLEVLKLLQKSYANKVKFIYIDPPYNTGSDFIYRDNFKSNLQSYLELTGQKSTDGQAFSSNTEASGKKHTNWLNMMLPRLKLAHSLLCSDGILLASIDEIEFTNLRKVCDEVFGEENHIADFVWKKKKGGGNDAKHVAVEHEYIVMYAKNSVNLHHLFEPYSASYLTRYKHEDSEGKYFWDTFLRKSGKQYYPIPCPDGSELEFDENGNRLSWLRSKARFDDDLSKGDVRILKKPTGGWSVQFKQRLPKGKKPRSIFLQESILDTFGTTSDGGARVIELFGKEVFSNPKPTKLLKHLLSFHEDKAFVCLDFFCGSGTLQDAVFQLNSEDNGKRNCISVQLPEIISGESELEKNARSFGFSTIADVARERITRAGKLTASRKETDIGFKAFKLSTSNIRAWNPDKADIEATLLDHKESLVEGRSEQDILYELLLKRGVELTVPIEEKQVNGKTIHSIGYGVLFACLDKSITSDDAEAIAQAIVDWRKELEPEINSHVYFRDSAFSGDNNIKSNLVAILDQNGISHVRSL